MDRSYFNIMDSIDPKFHSLVLTKINEISSQEGTAQEVTIDDFNQTDQMDVLGKYCISLHNEFTALRGFLLDNMEVCSRSIRVKKDLK